MDDRIEKLAEYLEKRYIQKKLLNLFLGALITLLCVFALIYMENIDREGILILRWMTVDGTLFTLILTVFFFAVNIIELRKNTELTRRAVYFARLSSAVAEAVIIIVVLQSQLTDSPMHVFRPDMFCMHIIIPLLVIASFTMNDSPLGKLKKREILYGTSFVTFYAVIILTLIGSGVIRGEYIPYSFLDIRSMSLSSFAAIAALFYVMGYALSALLSVLNRKVYWGWYRKK